MARKVPTFPAPRSHTPLVHTRPPVSMCRVEPLAVGVADEPVTVGVGVEPDPPCWAEAAPGTPRAIRSRLAPPSVINGRFTVNLPCCAGAPLPGAGVGTASNRTTQGLRDPRK